MAIRHAKDRTQPHKFQTIATLETIEQSIRRLPHGDRRGLAYNGIGASPVAKQVAGAGRDALSHAVAPDALQHRAAIADLVHTYARHIRAGNGAACADLFTEDAVFEMHVLNPEDMTVALHTRLEGRSAIIDHIIGASSPGARILPMIHNLIVEVDGDRAGSTCAMSAVIVPSGGDFFGEYSDSFRFADGWRFSARKHTILLNRAGKNGK